MGEFADAVQQIGRVIALSLPSQVLASDRLLASELDTKIAALGTRISALDVGLGVTFPPVRVIPVILRPTSLAWASTSIAFARTSYREFLKSTYLTIEICAPTILCCDPPTIEAILLHEFLHYIYTVVNVLRSSTIRDDGATVAQTVDEQPDYMDSWESYQAADPKQQANPTQWLPAEWHDLVIASSIDQQLSKATACVTERWLRPGYPVEVMDPNFRHEGALEIDEAIVDKAVRLGLLPIDPRK